MHMDQGLQAAIGGLKGWLRHEYRSRVDELHALVRENDTVRVEELLKGPRQGNIKHVVDFELEGMSSLHLAARRGNAEIAELLIDVGRADIHLQTREGDSPLHVAAQFGHEGVVAKLLQHGAVSDITTGNKLGDTPLHMAALANKPQIVKSMLSKAPDRQACLHAKNKQLRTVLHHAAGCHEPETVDLLLSGTNEAQALKESADTNGAIPFHLAACSGHVKSLEMLVPADIDVVSSKNGFTALHYAAWHANDEAVKWLIEKGASFKQSKLQMLDTPLHLVARRGKELPAGEKVVEMIADYAPPSSWKMKNGDGKLAIGMADEGEHGHVVRAILRSVRLRSAGQLDGDEIFTHRNMPNCATLLHYAAGHGTKDDIEWLMGTAGKNLIDIEDERLRTPLHWAAMKGNTNTLEALAKAGANLMKMSKKYETPLFIALGENHFEFAEKLQQWGTYMEQASRKAAAGRQRGAAGNDLTRIDTKDHQDWMKGVEKWMMVYYDEKVDKRVQEELSSKFNRLTQRERSNLNMFEEIPPLYLALHAGSLDMAKFFQRLSSSSSSSSTSGGEDAEDALNKKGVATRRTPLHWAVLLRKQDIVKQLCYSEPEFREKIKPLEEDKYQFKPIQYAIKYANDSTMQNIEAELLKHEGESSYIKRLHLERQIYVDSTNAILVVATLIASVTFAGWLQSPSTYEDHVFNKRSKAIRAFWVFICLSFFAAIGAIQAGAYGVLPRRHVHVQREVIRIRRALTIASLLMASSVTSVLGAFGAAGFVILVPISKQDIYMAVIIAIGGVINMCVILWFFQNDLVASLRMQMWRLGFQDRHHGVFPEITSQMDQISPSLEPLQQKPTIPWDDDLEELYK